MTIIAEFYLKSMEINLQLFLVRTLFSINQEIKLKKKPTPLAIYECINLNAGTSYIEIHRGKYPEQRYVFVKCFLFSFDSSNHWAMVVANIDRMQKSTKKNREHSSEFNINMERIFKLGKHEFCACVWVRLLISQNA